MRILLTLLMLSPLLTACDFFKDDEGRLDLSITDAPVDGASSIVVRIAGVDLYHEDGEQERFDFNPALDVDLLALSGGDSLRLLSDERIPEGRYERVRLRVTSSETTTDSNIVIDGATYSLYVPSDASGGLSILGDLKVEGGRRAAYTIDFDLRRSVFAPTGGGTAYALRPVLRLVEDGKAGSIGGTVADTRLVTGCVPAVYVYAGEDVSPDDVGGSGAQPLSSARVVAAGGGHRYDVAFLPEGRYTVAFTCDAGRDDPATNDNLNFTARNVSVQAGRTASVNF